MQIMPNSANIFLLEISSLNSFTLYQRVLLSSDSGLLFILTLLDLTSAFDTIKLPSHLQTIISITEPAVSWLKSYLFSRKLFTHIKNCLRCPSWLCPWSLTLCYLPPQSWSNHPFSQFLIPML